MKTTEALVLSSLLHSVFFRRLFKCKFMKRKWFCAVSLGSARHLAQCQLRRGTSQLRYPVTHKKNHAPLLLAIGPVFWQVSKADVDHEPISVSFIVIIEKCIFIALTTSIDLFLIYVARHNTSQPWVVLYKGCCRGTRRILHLSILHGKKPINNY